LFVVLYIEIGILDNNVRITESCEGVYIICNACDLVRLRRIIRT